MVRRSADVRRSVLVRRDGCERRCGALTMSHAVLRRRQSVPRGKTRIDRVSRRQPQRAKPAKRHRIPLPASGGGTALLVLLSIPKSMCFC